MYLLLEREEGALLTSVWQEHMLCRGTCEWGTEVMGEHEDTSSERRRAVPQCAVDSEDF